MEIRLKDIEDFKKTLITKGFSQRSFCEHAAISNPHFNQIINGNRNPSPTMAKKIADNLDMEFEEIFFIHVDNKLQANCSGED
ncbi:helix-turn-helix domain-containing protein [Bacillus sp. B-jedd]|uniref:helix-turn-helix domain-containing protein n=1 Tax=Bacillus sp. B-jedd TaxID=1476857 RepID=UPI0005156CAB|nr:helix-turn-helix transcriptional regulator [Bacillus sp. B-jedd]CEG29601.1 helix-turn-helix domain-containing protein [Bacillus sp. B-jedd]